MDLTPSFLLANPELITPVAPWCVRLENLELGMLLLAQPWLAGDGLRRADLEHQLTRLAAELPLGQVYFQRVKRAVTRLEQIGAMRGNGSGRQTRFVVTAQGLAALILNLQVVHTDPTINGAELELKRSLVAMWNLVVQRLAELPDELAAPAATGQLLREVQELTVLGEHIITEQVLNNAFDILRLIATQREQVQRLLGAARERLRQVTAEAAAFRSVDLSRLAAQGFSGAAELLASAPETAAVVRGMASGQLPQLSLEARVLRYQQFLCYLESLATLYTNELRTVDLATVRKLRDTRSA